MPETRRAAPPDRRGTAWFRGERKGAASPASRAGGQGGRAGRTEKWSSSFRIQRLPQHICRLAMGLLQVHSLRLHLIFPRDEVEEGLMIEPPANLPLPLFLHFERLEKGGPFVDHGLHPAVALDARKVTDQVERDGLFRDRQRHENRELVVEPGVLVALLHPLPVVLVVVLQTGWKGVELPLSVRALLDLRQHIVEVHEVAFAQADDLLDEVRVLQSLGTDVGLNAVAAQPALREEAHVREVVFGFLLEIDLVLGTGIPERWSAPPRGHDEEGVVRQVRREIEGVRAPGDRGWIALVQSVDQDQQLLPVGLELRGGFLQEIDQEGRIAGDLRREMRSAETESRHELRAEARKELIGFLNPLGADIEVMRMPVPLHHLRDQGGLADPRIAEDLDIASRLFLRETVDRIEKPLPAHKAFGLAGDQQIEGTDLLADRRRCVRNVAVLRGGRAFSEQHPGVGMAVDDVGEGGGISGLCLPKMLPRFEPGVPQGRALSKSSVETLSEGEGHLVPHRPERRDKGAAAGDSHPMGGPATDSSQRPALLRSPTGIQDDQWLCLTDPIGERSFEIRGTEGA